MIEKLIEKRPYRGGLKITAGQKMLRIPQKPRNSELSMVPVTGLEPVRCRQRWILSPLRLPFHHTGKCYQSIIQQKIKNSKGEFAERTNSP